jgi:hypothetical protein
VLSARKYVLRHERHDLGAALVQVSQPYKHAIQVFEAESAKKPRRIQGKKL